MPDGFSSAAEAAKAALKQAVPMSDKFEYAGAIYQVGDKYYFTPPKSSEETHDVKVKVSYPRGAKLTALYNTHPEGKESERFSAHDIDVSRQLKIPYYMGHYSDGALKVFDPQKTRIDSRRHRSETLEWSTGDPIGNAFEDDEPMKAQATK